MRMLETSVAAFHTCWPEAQREVGTGDEKCWLGCVFFFSFLFVFFLEGNEEELST